MFKSMCAAIKQHNLLNTVRYGHHVSTFSDMFGAEYLALLQHFFFLFFYNGLISENKWKSLRRWATRKRNEWRAPDGESIKWSTIRTISCLFLRFFSSPRRFITDLDFFLFFFRVFIICFAAIHIMRLRLTASLWIEIVVNHSSLNDPKHVCLIPLLMPSPPDSKQIILFRKRSIFRIISMNLIICAAFFYFFFV